ncbi:unnamed protein product [Gongylonema pulchrum]|uniref:Chloride channel protein n=1 Tax=Gongylonema pulchrum TaxID=637853 RepID=A0A183E552_9BILA|nr:unnamed protein product [Gongylonema pulchrum]
MGAIVATILSKVTTSCQYTAFFSNEGREMEMLSSGCAVGIACTFSAPVGAVLYAIESTSKYFAVKNYWRGFLAATCSAIVFRFANFFVTAEQSGVITAFYQTSIPTESFLVEELPVFAALGLLGGLFAALFIFTHKRITLFRQNSRIYHMIFRENFFTFTIFMALVFFLVAVCISINVPAGVFVPSFVIGAAGGRLMGEGMAFFFPEGLRGAGGPLIFPGLYAVVESLEINGPISPLEQTVFLRFFHLFRQLIGASPRLEVKAVNSPTPE